MGKRFLRKDVYLASEFLPQGPSSLTQVGTLGGYRPLSGASWPPEKDSVSLIACLIWKNGQAHQARDMPLSRWPVVTNTNIRDTGKAKQLLQTPDSKM